MATPFISYIAGSFMDSPLSKPMIKRFARQNGIDLNQAAETRFKSFNAFFTRHLKDGLRPLCGEGLFASPCDALLSVYTIKDESRFQIKGASYSIADLVEDEGIAQDFSGGRCLIFRLTPAHYHRYIFPCDGSIIDHKKIKGIYHTVRPTAVEKAQVLRTNTREYVLCETEEYGRLLIMEVGALLVGRIVNHKTSGDFSKGEEKGYFEFGGSTVVVLAQKDRLNLDRRFDTQDEKSVYAGEALTNPF